MNTLKHIVVSLFIAACVMASLPEAVAQDSYTVAILPFDTNDKLDMDDMGQEFPLLLNAYMSQSDKLAFVERGQIDSALGELAIGISGTVDPATAAQIGYLTGAQVLVTGRIFPVQKDLFIVAKIIGVETGRVYGETAKIPLRGDMDEAAQDLAEKVAVSIETKGDSLVAKVEAKDDIVASLRPLVKGKNLPTVSVAIEEESLGRQLIDPAAQTELLYILHQLGFTIIDPAESNVRADIEITGEAFSEFGMRNGSLVSSSGRVEVKAVDVSTGEVVGVGRHVSVAVDLSREIAGKAAITKATVKIAAALIADIVS
jgi:curli biogenesis system outer membrane secretion channel CsgG